MSNGTEVERNKIISDLVKFIRKPGVLNSLMNEKKLQLVKDPNQLVFLGAADLAEYYWCAEKSLLKSKKNELSYFENYLIDRIVYSFDLGRIANLPEEKNKLMSVGDDITEGNIEYLLSQRKPQTFDSDVNFMVAKKGKWLSLGVVNGKCYILGFPDNGAKFGMSKELEFNEAVFVSSIEDPVLPPKLRGVVGEEAYAEKYPSIRWNFPFGKYIVVAVPDGITKDFAYEFKTTMNSFMKYFIKAVADTQADLYGHFFGRREKRVQIREYESRHIYTYQTEVNEQRVKEVHEGFQAIDSGEKAKPPKVWKCKACEFKLTCKISQA